MNITNIPKIGETDGQKNKKAYLHFYNQLGQGDWYVCEAEKQGNDIIFYGYVKLFFDEWGYFSLNELESIPSIVQDKNFQECSIEEII